MYNESSYLVTSITIINEQAFAVFTLIEVADALISKARKHRRTESDFFEYGVEELDWLESEQEKIYERIKEVIGQYPDSEVCRYIESTIEKDEELIAAALELLCDSSGERITNSQTASPSHRVFVQGLTRLSTSLKQTYNLLNSYRDGLPD